MTRAVYIGGFGNGKKLAQGVNEALVASGSYEDADHFTFSNAITNPDKVARAVKGVDVYTHSAGILAVKDARPKEIVAVGAPLPTNISRLITGTIEKSAYMAGHALTGVEAFKAVGRYNASSLAELARHPLGNLRHLREIAGTNAIELAGVAREVGIPTRLFYNEQDIYFQPTDEQQMLARMLGVELRLIPGQHDELPLYPVNTLEQIRTV